MLNHNYSVLQTKDFPSNTLECNKCHYVFDVTNLRDYHSCNCILFPIVCDPKIIRGPSEKIY